MKRIFPGILAAILVVVTPAAIRAETVRYSFDVIGSEIGFRDLYNYSRDDIVVTPDSAEYAAFTAARHA